MPNPIYGEPPSGVKGFMVWPDIATPAYRVTTIAAYHAMKSELVGLQPRLLAPPDDSIAKALELAAALGQPVYVRKLGT